MPDLHNTNRSHVPKFGGSNVPPSLARTFSVDIAGGDLPRNSTDGSQNDLIGFDEDRGKGQPTDSAGGDLVPDYEVLHDTALPVAPITAESKLGYLASQGVPETQAEDSESAQDDKNVENETGDPESASDGNESAERVVEPPRQEGGGPTDPPGQTSEVELPEPERGRKLQQIADYGAIAGEAFRDAVEERRTIAQGDHDESLRLLDDRGVSLDEADDLLRPLHPYDLQEEVATAERQHAELQYGEALEATGLRLHSSLQGVEVQMVDPARFAVAMQEAEYPEDAIAQENLSSQTQAIIDEALDRASKAIVLQYADEARIICGGTPPMGEAFVEAAEGFRASDEDIALVDAFAAEFDPTSPRHHSNAEVIAEEFDRIEGHEATVEGAEQLALARSDNLVIEWGVGRHIGIIGDKDVMLGVERLVSEDQWDAAYNYLGHLQSTAPGAAFTANVRDAVIRDIDTALRELPHRTEFAEDYDDYSFHDAYDISPHEELEIGDSTIPTLRFARDRVRDIFGL